MQKVKKFPVPLGFESLDAYLRLRNVDNHCFILESIESDAKWTFIGWEPSLGITVKNGQYIQTNLLTGTVEQDIETGNPAALIEEVIAQRKQVYNPELPPFVGGLMGYFSYDYIKYAEPNLKPILENFPSVIPAQAGIQHNLNDQGDNTPVAGDDAGFNDIDLLLFDKIIAVDQVKQEIIVILNNADTVTSEADFENIYQLIVAGTKAERPKLQLHSDEKWLKSKPEFMKMVEKAKHYINEGDIFQVVLSNLVSFDATGSLFDVYRYLRKHNPSPYMYYLSSDDIEIAGSSPETLVSAKYEDCDFVARTFPLAGTRPRGTTDDEDQRLERDLLQDDKELAEHNMLVDLGRNDIGKVSEFGTVEVEDYMSVLRYSHVMHLGSKVKGKIVEGKNALDVIGAVLPAGTLSGAPKIRACEIINELEGDNRGIYGGCLGYLSFDGQMDMCITIRSAYMKNDQVYARSGAGIVLDSNPKSEFIESKNKLQSVMNAIKDSNV
jgi:anthranilate synthase component 1